MVSSSFRRAPRVKLLCALVASCFAAEGFANPTGPAVVSGSATFNTVGKNLTVTNSPNAIINWQGFSIGAGEATRFQQQSAASAVLNRIVGQDPSVILGTLSSNGRVFLVNPNGILFGQGSRVDVGGLVASTLNITDRDFLAGRLNFQAGAVANSIVNHGEIVSSSGGRIYLVAPDVQNHGLISSPSGEVVLAAGKTVSLVDADVPNLQVEVQAGGEALNVGKILVEGGKAGIYAGLIDQRGIVRADSVSKDATGRIVFKASDTTILDAGSVTSAAGAKGGEIQVLGNKVGLAGTAQIDASGDAGGGTVLVGGDFQGKNAAIQNASRTYVGADASINADAGVSGDGGKVIVWADDATRFYGSISARGGAQGGNGGSVEVSGKKWLDFNGHVNTLAPNGKAGELLLDPTNVFIAASLASANAAGMSGSDASASTFSAGMFEASGAVQDSFLSTVTLVTALTTNNVKVSTANPSGTGVGNITVVDPVFYVPSLAGDLTLLAHNNITVNGAITNNGLTGATIAMYAGWDGVSTVTPAVNGLGIGSINVNQSISNNFNGTTTLTAAKDINVTSATVSTGSGTSLTAVKGNITLTSATVSSNGNVSLSAPVGAILVNTSRVGAESSDGAVTMSAAAIGVLDSNGSNGIYAGGVEGSGTITLTATNGITVNNSVLATEAGSSQAAAISLTAGGVITVAGGSTIVSDSSADASVTLNGAGGVAISGSSVVQALASNQASVSIQATNPGAAISIADSEVSALFAFSGNSLSTVTMNAAGALSISGNSPIEAYSSTTANVSLTAGGNISIGAGPSPVVEARGGPNANVFVQSTGGNVEIGGDILSDATSVPSMNISAPAGAITSVGGGILNITGTAGEIGLSALNGIGTPAKPIRIDNNSSIDVAATNSGTLGDIAISFVNGGVTLIPGDLTNVLNSNPTGTYMVQAESGSILLSTAFQPDNAALVAGQSVILKALAGNVSLDSSGTILATGTGNVTLEAGNNTVSLSGPGTQVTGNNVTFIANDMNLAGGVSGTGTVTLAPFTTSRSIHIESTPSAGVLSLAPGEVGNVSAGTLDIGRSDGTGTLAVNAALEMGGVAALRLFGGDVNLSSNITKSSGADASLSLIAKNSIQTFSGADITSTSNKLDIVLNSDSDASGAGRITLNAGTVITSNGGNVTLGGGANPATGFAVGDGGSQHGVQLNGATITSGAGNITIHGQGASGTAFAAGVRLESAAVLQTSTGSVDIVGVGGAGLLGGANRGILVSGAGTMISSAGGTVTLAGTGGSSTGSSGLDGQGNPTDGVNRGITIADGAVVQTTGAGNIVMTGTGGTSVDRGQNSGVLISQDAALGTRVTTVNGNITITGTGGSTSGAGATIGANRGVSIGSAEVRATGTGAISITGTGGTSVNGTSTSTNSGVLIQGNPDVVEVFVTTAGGALSITGTAGSTSGTIVAHEGIAIVNDANVQATGGALTLIGTASPGNPAIEIDAVGGSVNPAHAFVEGGTVTVTANGLLTLAGGTGTGEFAVLQSIGDQTVNATGIVLTGGASGGGLNTGNPASIRSFGNQNISVGSGGLTLTGGGGALTDNLAIVYQAGLAGTSQTITVHNGGSINLQGGSSAQTNVGAGHGSRALIQSDGDSQLINFTAGGALSLTGGTAGSRNFAQIVALNGSQTISGSPTITLTGGPSGGVDGEGNFALIQANAGAQSITAGNLTLQAGAGGINNFASIISPTQTITVHGDLSLTGGGSAAGTNMGGGARIGGPGGASPGPTNLNLTVDGNVTMTGGSVANSGTAIGSNFLGGQTHTITMDVGGNVTLNPGTVANAGSRIGSPASNIAGGDIAITAGGALALNSAGPGLGTAIRTLGNVTIDAASITQGADSEIIAGGVTTLSAGTVSLISPTNQFSTVVLNTTGNVALKDLDAINFGTSTTDVGSLTVHAPGGIAQSGPITTGAASFNAGANAITLTNPGNDFTGAVNLTGSSASITDANALALSTSSLGSGSLVVNASGAITQGGAITAGAASFNAGSNPITLTNASNDFTGAVSLTGTTVSITDANTLTLGAVSATDLTVNGAAIDQNGSGVVVGGTSTLAASTITLNSATNDFGTVSVSSPGDVSLTDANAITIANAAVAGAFNITAASTSFLSGFSASNYTFSGGSYTLAAGTYNLGGTTTIASSATVTASGATINAAGGTMNVSGTFSVFGGSVNVGTLNVIAGGALTGTGTIVGNVNNSGGTVLPGASPGVLTINGNYVQGPGGALAIDIGGTTAGTQYDQLIVSGNASLGGTLSTALIGGFVPPPGSTYTFIQAAGGVTGTFSTINQPLGALFDTFYGPTTFEFIATGVGGGVVPPLIEPSFNQSIVSIEQVLEVLLDVGGAAGPVMFGAGVVAPTTTTTPEGKIVPKPPACN